MGKLLESKVVRQRRVFEAAALRQIGPNWYCGACGAQAEVGGGHLEALAHNSGCPLDHHLNEQI